MKFKQLKQIRNISEKELNQLVRIEKRTGISGIKLIGIKKVGKF